MITGLSGKLVKLGPNWADISVGGVTLRVFVPVSYLDGLGKVGGQASLQTSLQVREDSLTLYGFPTEEGRLAFETLLQVNGIGPKHALSILSRLSPEELAAAVERGDVDAFDLVPGIGKKTAQRIILELKGKLADEWALATSGGGASDVVAALVALGYSAGEAREAAAALPKDDTLSLEDRIRLALQKLGG
ncbi:MAG: Holliday junction branch migration protein RuvA [SAR202 cluster bacterium]|nr:Holliday junction branch migration protein RuvA [SAR202 cluster bacterium]